MRTTIKDIAADTGLSITTISLVLNGKGDRIPVTTKKLIYKSVEKHGYRPNQLAISLLKRQTKTIGLIISDIRNVFFAALAKAIEDECHLNHLNLILCNSNDEHQRDIEYINVLADKGVDGIIYGMSIDTDFTKAADSCNLMAQLRIPFVMIDRYFNEFDYYSVRTDHVIGGYLATSHLLNKGHTRIACITGPSNLQDSIDRLTGYRMALDERNIPFDPTIIVAGSYMVESGINAVDLLKGKDFTAVFAFNDLTALGAYNAIRKNNLSVPEDISLVGYDDIFFSNILEVPLTTVHQPISEMGSLAVQKLLALAKEQKIRKKNMIIRPSLVIRDSTAPVQR